MHADLGFVPFVEDETGETFVMGQQEFLRRYLVVHNRGKVPIGAQVDGSMTEHSVASIDDRPPAAGRSGNGRSTSKRESVGNDVYDEDYHEHKTWDT